MACRRLRVATQYVLGRLRYSGTGNEISNQTTFPTPEDAGRLPHDDASSATRPRPRPVSVGVVGTLGGGNGRSSWSATSTLSMESVRATRTSMSAAAPTAKGVGWRTALVTSSLVNNSTAERCSSLRPSHCARSRCRATPGDDSDTGTLNLTCEESKAAAPSSPQKGAAAHSEDRVPHLAST